MSSSGISEMRTINDSPCIEGAQTGHLVVAIMVNDDNRAIFRRAPFVVE